MKKRMPDASPDEVEKAAAEMAFEEVSLFYYLTCLQIRPVISTSESYSSLS